MLEEVSFLRHLVREGKIGRLPLDDALRHQAVAKGRGQIVPLGEILVQDGQLGVVEMQDLLKRARARDRGSVEVELAHLRQSQATGAPTPTPRQEAEEFGGEHSARLRRPRTWWS